MIKTEKFEIKFQRNYSEIKNKKGTVLGHSVETVVSVNLNDEEHLIGNAVCSYKDRFVKEEGRKLALRRALYLCFDKKQRRAIWKAYFDSKTVNKPRLVQHF